MTLLRRSGLVVSLSLSLSALACRPSGDGRAPQISVRRAALGESQGLGGQWAQVYTSHCVVPNSAPRGGILATSDGGLLLGGEDNGKFCAIKLAADRTVEWERHYGGSGNEGWISELERGADSSQFVFAGRTSSFWDTRQDEGWFFNAALVGGGLNWQVRYGGSPGPGGVVMNDFFRAVRFDANTNNYYLAGYSGSAAPFSWWLMRAESDTGGALWERGFLTNSAGGQQALDVLSDGSVIMSSDHDVMRVEANGKPVWRKSYGVDYIARVRAMPDEGFVMLTIQGGEVTPHVVRLNRDGNVMWAHRLGGGTETLLDLRPAPSGAFFLTGGVTRANVGGSSDRDVWVVKLDGGGNVLWQKIFGGDGWDLGASVLPMDDDGVIVSAATQSFGSSDPTARLWLLRLDAQGSAGACSAYMGNTAITAVDDTISVTDGDLASSAFVSELTRTSSVATSAASSLEAVLCDQELPPPDGGAPEFVTLGGTIRWQGAPAAATSQTQLKLDGAFEGVAESSTASFEIPNVATGTHTIETQSVGCSTSGVTMGTRSITVSAAGTVDVDITATAGKVVGDFTIDGSWSSDLGFVFLAASAPGDCPILISGFDGHLVGFLPPGSYSAALSNASAGPGIATGRRGYINFTVTAGAVTNLGTIELHEAETNLANNQTCAGFPSPLESDHGWGAGTRVCDIVDGKTFYGTWMSGLAFTGGHQTVTGGPSWEEPAGVRHAVIDFGAPKSFHKVTMWWHGTEYTPQTATLEVWNGASWSPIPGVVRDYGKFHVDGWESGYADSDDYTFPAVTASKVRYTFDNSGNNILGTLNIHGWLYEMEVWSSALDQGATTPDGGAASDGGGVADGGVVEVGPPPGLPVGATCTPADVCADGNPCVDGVCCASACGGGDTHDCQACSVAAGSSANGTCTALPVNLCTAVPPGKTSPSSPVTLLGGQLTVYFDDGRPNGWIQVAPTSAPVPPPSNFKVVVNGSSSVPFMWDITTSAGAFVGSATVCVNYQTPRDLSDSVESRLAFLHYDEAKPCVNSSGVMTPWCPLTSSALTNATANRFCAVTDKFSPFALVLPLMPPVVTVPASVVAEATGSTGAKVTYAASATDEEDGPLTPSCAPASGSTFPIGDTVVTCGATDSNGMTGTAAFTVTVRDTTGPVLSGVPAPITAYATSTAGAKVTYTAPTAKDAVDGTRPVTCTPASGSTFAAGKKTVTCTAADTRGNATAKSFDVWVQYQAPADGTFFLLPVRANGTSIFRIGRPVPVRFKLTGASKGITNLVAKLVVTKLSNTVQGTAEDASDETVDDTDFVFKYRPGLGFYAYRWKTSNQTQGTYELRADLGDGVTHKVNVSLKK